MGIYVLVFGLPPRAIGSLPRLIHGAGQDLYGKRARLRGRGQRVTGGKRHQERERRNGHVCKVSRGQNQPQR